MNPRAPHISPTRPNRRTAAVLLVLTAALALAGCGQQLSGPAATVQKALELRRDLVSDAKQYTPLFADPTIGAQLAKDSASATRTPIPAWDRPYVSSLGTSTADVVVAWKHTDARFKSWPKASIFALRLAKGLWVIVDATDATGTLPPAAEGGSTAATSAP